MISLVVLHICAAGINPGQVYKKCTFKNKQTCKSIYNGHKPLSCGPEWKPVTSECPRCAWHPKWRSLGASCISWFLGVRWLWASLPRAGSENPPPELRPCLWAHQAASVGFSKSRKTFVFRQLRFLPCQNQSPGNTN